MELTNAETTLLGLLSEEAMYPYQIEQEVKYRDMRFWTELSMSSIYKLLTKFENEGLVERTNRVTAENRVQKLYSLTEKGRETLILKIESILSKSEHMRWQIDIGTSNCNVLPKEKVIESLKKYKIDLQEKIIGYQNLKKFLSDSECPQHRMALAIRPIYLLEAEINWVDSYMSDLANTPENK